MVGFGEWEANCNSLSRAVASTVKMEEVEGRGTVTVCYPYPPLP
jgi:hypothetical protein